MIAKTAGWVSIVCIVAAGCAYGAAPFQGTIIKVIDGDSIVIATRTKKIEVRLYGIDCPEYNQPYAADAKHFSNTTVQGRQVLVTPYYYDTYGRMVAVVMVGEKSLNNELVREGLAWVYPRYCRKPFCHGWKEDEQQARTKKKGLWSAHKVISPWDWKRMKRDN